MSELSAETRAAVHGLLDDRLVSLGPGTRLDSERGEVLVALGDAVARVSTESLLTACSAQPAGQWPEVVTVWLENVRRSLEVTTNESRVDAARLRVQAVPRSAEPAVGVSAGFNSAFDLLVVEDRDGHVRRLQQADLDDLGMSAGEAAGAALNATIVNVLTRLDVRAHPLPGGPQVRMASADGVPYVSAGVSSIPQLAGVALPYGALVGVPQHSALMILPMESRRSLAAGSMLAGFVSSMYDQSPDPCARDLYWFVGGDAYRLDVEAGADGRPELVLPAELGQTAASLPG